MPNKSTLINIINIIIGHIGQAETLVRSPRRWSVKPCMVGEAPPPFLTAHSTGVGCIFTLVLPCETLAESSDDQLHSAWGITEPFVLGDEMTESGGLVRLLTSRSQHVSWARLGSSEVTKGTIVPFDPSAFSATGHLSLPLSARMQNNKTFHFLPK